MKGCTLTSKTVTLETVSLWVERSPEEMKGAGGIPTAPRFLHDLTGCLWTGVCADRRTASRGQVWRWSKLGPWELWGSVRIPTYLYELDLRQIK